MWVFFVVPPARPVLPRRPAQGASPRSRRGRVPAPARAGHRRLSQAVWPGAVLSVAAAAYADDRRSPPCSPRRACRTARSPPCSRRERRCRGPWERTVVVTGSTIWAAFLDTTRRAPRCRRYAA
ncbi:hypothetical protein HBB16_03490 [Pseudonocardia sp. MCCB 268]|nr:hypothetical protein [Pseudonocardia cytotoxica]